MVNAVISSGGYAIKADIAIDIPPDLVFEADRQKLSYVIDVLLANGVNVLQTAKEDLDYLPWLANPPVPPARDTGQWRGYHRDPAR